MALSPRAARLLWLARDASRGGVQPAQRGPGRPTSPAAAAARILSEPGATKCGGEAAARPCRRERAAARADSPQAVELARLHTVRAREAAREVEAVMSVGDVQVACARPSGRSASEVLGVQAAHGRKHDEKVGVDDRLCEPAAAWHGAHSPERQSLSRPAGNDRSPAGRRGHDRFGSSAALAVTAHGPDVQDAVDESGNSSHGAMVGGAARRHPRVQCSRDDADDEAPSPALCAGARYSSESDGAAADSWHKSDASDAADLAGTRCAGTPVGLGAAASWSKGDDHVTAGRDVYRSAGMKMDDEPASVDGASGGGSGEGSGWTYEVEIVRAPTRAELRQGAHELALAFEHDGLRQHRGRHTGNEAKCHGANLRRSRRDNGSPLGASDADEEVPAEATGVTAWDEERQDLRPQPCARAQGSTGIIGPHRVTGDSRSDPHLGRSRSLPDILRLVIAALVMGMGRELSTAESAQLPGLLCGRVISALEALEPDADADRVRRTIASQAALLAVGLRFGREAMHAIDDDSMSTV